MKKAIINGVIHQDGVHLASTVQVVMRANPKLCRPAELKLLIGDSAKPKLGCEPKTTLEQLCQMMVKADLRRNQPVFSF